MPRARRLGFGANHHPLRRLRTGNENGQVKHKAAKWEQDGKRVAPPRSRKNPARVGW